MQIQSVESLKTWLTSRLEPICDADPAALAKYVVALVKKDKPPSELKDVCVDQLEVFLSNNTIEFVDTLFEALSTNSYMPPVATETAPTSTTPVTAVIPQLETTQQPSILEDPVKVHAEPLVVDEDDRDFKRTRKTTDSSEKNNGSTVVSSSGDRYRKRRADDDSARSDCAKVIRDEHGHRRRTDSGPQSDNNEEHDREVRHKIDTSIRDRWHDSRDGNHFEGRNRRGMPMWNRHDDRGFRGGRERFISGRHGPPGTRRQRCRDYDEKGFCMRGELCPFDHGNDPVVVEDVSIQGMLGFPAGPPPFLPDRAPLPLQPPGLQGNMGPVPPGVFPVPSSQPPPPGSTPLPGSKIDSEVTEGSNPPVSASGSGSGPTSTATPAPPVMMPPRIVASVPRPLPPGIVPRVHPMISTPIRGDRPRLPMLRPRPPFEDSYNPEQPQFDRLPVWQRLGTTPPAPFPHAPYNPNMNLRSRELVAVPPDQTRLPPEVPVPGMVPISVPAPPTASLPQQPLVEAATTPARVVLPLENQTTQPPVPRAPTGNTNTGTPGQTRFRRTETLELKKIPRELNTISKLNEYFQRFGSIINIQVCAFGDPAAALIKFSRHEEARAAHSCPDAVLGNRFIRVFWHNPDRDQNQQGGNKNVERPNQLNHSREQNDRNKAPIKVLPTMFQSGKTTFVKKAAPNDTTRTSTAAAATTMATLPTATPVTQSATPPVMQAAVSAVTAPKPVVVTTKQTLQQQKKEIMKKKMEIQKQKQLLLNKQIQQQKLLIGKLEKKNITASEKETILKTIKSLNANVETLKKEVEIAAIAAKSKESPTQARQLAQKAILDQELELITHQQTGEDTTELRHTVEQLKQEAQALGLLGPSPIGRGAVRSRGSWVRSGGRGRGRGHTRGRGINTSRSWTRENAVLDNRSRQIAVADVTSDMKEDVIEHFMEFGNVDRVEHDKDKGSLVLTFRTRKEAEIALTQGVKHKSKNYSLSWHTPTPTTPTPVPVPVPTPPRTPISATTPGNKAASEPDLDLDLEAELGKGEGDDKDPDEVLLLGDFDEEEDDDEDRAALLNTFEDCPLRTPDKVKRKQKAAESAAATQACSEGDFTPPKTF